MKGLAQCAVIGMLFGVLGQFYLSPAVQDETRRAWLTRSRAEAACVIKGLAQCVVIGILCLEKITFFAQEPIDLGQFHLSHALQRVSLSPQGLVMGVQGETRRFMA